MCTIFAVLQLLHQEHFSCPGQVALASHRQVTGQSSHLHWQVTSLTKEASTALASPSPLNRKGQLAIRHCGADLTILPYSLCCCMEALVEGTPDI